MNGINLQREYFFKQDLLHRWRDAGVSEAQLDDWVTDGALRLALPARKIIGDGALGSILLDDFSTEAVSSITGHLAGLLNMSPQEIDDKILSPAGNQERLQGAKIEPLSATDYLYQTRWRHSVVADIYSRRSSGERKKTRHFATVFYDSKHRLRLLISGEQGGIYTVCGYSVSTEADYVFPLEEVVAFEARHAGGGPLPDNSGVEPYIQPPVNQVNFVLGGNRNNRPGSTNTSHPGAESQAVSCTGVSQETVWTLNKPLVFRAYTEPLYNLLKTAHDAGKRCPTVVEVLTEWGTNPPAGSGIAVSDNLRGITYHTAAGKTAIKIVTSKAIGQAISRMTST